ncbi:CYFIP-related Rac1 interactor B-like [Sycon ciliatum]|uniref:CYFIP-related Rac1 interactor B-like n=1 Tax=Sycon ciliatum TaxID=27933 RepID=UPI0031F6E61E|eukprot:scpid17836/ scgid25304/ Protein FAM49B; L1 &gt; Protein FAM49B
MGNLLNVLSNSSSGSSDVDLFLDFESSEPSDAEKTTYEEVQEILKNCPTILSELGQYEGAGTEIRLAISSPTSEELQTQAWNAVCPRVAQLKQYHQFSNSLQTSFTSVISELLKGEQEVREKLASYQSLAKQLAHILHFALTFDDLKMTNPAIQNDFSYYRRTQNKAKMLGSDAETSSLITAQEANVMSLFYANATPMMKTISDSMTQFVKEHQEIPLDRSTELLSTLSNICRIMIENPEYRQRLSSEDSTLFCLRVMVATIILYDFTNPNGAFSKKSQIDVRQSVRLLKDIQTHTPSCSAGVESLLNALRYTTRHLNDESTPKPIKQLLAT